MARLKKTNTYIEATDMAILIRGKAFQSFGASSFGCLVAFSAESSAMARSRFTLLLLEATVLLGAADGSWRFLVRTHRGKGAMRV